MATIKEINNNNDDNVEVKQQQQQLQQHGESANIFDEIISSFEKKTNVTEEDLDRLMEIFSKFNSTTVWSKVKRDDFTVRRFESGYVADTCCCELTPDAMKRLDVKPGDDHNDCVGIVVKYKNTNFNNLFDSTVDAWINVNTILVAEAIEGLTPRVVYLDRHCSVQEYIPSRTYSYEDDCDPETVRQLARILARIHCLRLPLSNNGNKVGGFFDFCEKNPYTKTTYLDYLQQDTQERKDKYYKLLAQMDLKESNSFAINLCRKVNSPVMMSQGDFNRTNRLVREVIRNNNNNNNDVVVKKEIFLIDLDNSGYDLRGIDLGRYFSNYKHKEDIFGTGAIPSDEEMLIFLGEYRDECCRLLGKRFERDPRNTTEHLLLEAKAFTLLIHSFDSAFSAMLYKPDSEKADYYLNASTGLYQCYLALKRHMTNDGTIKKILGK